MAKAIDEIELNLKVKDLDGLLEFLRGKAEERITKKHNVYFKKNTDDQSFYARLEEIEDKNGKRKALTVKWGFNDEDNGMSRRKELTTAVEDLEFFETMFEVMGLARVGQKRKVRHAFMIGELEVAVDEWSDEELGNRVEIEGENEKEIWKFKDNLTPFTEAA